MINEDVSDTSSFSLMTSITLGQMKEQQLLSQRKGDWEGGNNGDWYFLSKNIKVDPGSTNRTSLGLRLSMYIYMNL